MSDEEPGREDERTRRHRAERADSTDGTPARDELTDEQIDAETPGVDDAAELEAAEDELAAEAAEDEDKVVATPARRRGGIASADDTADDDDPTEDTADGATDGTTDEAAGGATASRVRRRDRPGARPTGDVRPAGRGSGRAITADGSGTGTRSRAAAEKARAEELRDKRSIGRFLREVVAELRKVIWPGRRELITYTTVVIVFVAFMVALVAGLDILFAQGVIAVFG